MLRTLPVSDDQLGLVSAGQPEALMIWDEVGSDELLEPPVGCEDFLRSMKGIKPTVSQDELGQVAEWSAKFGSEG